jgi:hypothetical protein
MYAYHFFFRRMIPVRFMEPHEGKTPYRINFERLDDLLPEQDLGTDVICNAIMNATDFIYPEESLEHSSYSAIID